METSFLPPKTEAEKLLDQYLLLEQEVSEEAHHQADAESTAADEFIYIIKSG